MRHLLDPSDFSVNELYDLLKLACDMQKDPAHYNTLCAHKKLATLFYEPSTRTRLSFEAAMLNLGGQVLGFATADSSSVSKGESVADTIRVVSSYADIAAMRHPKEGAAMRAADYSRIPVINAGDGGHAHPTQTLTDLMTIQKRCGRLDNITVGLCGDLKYGRTVHSLIRSLCRYENVHFVLISPTELALPRYLISENIAPSGADYVEIHDLAAAMPKLDILYMTRIQKERFADLGDYNRLKDSYILTAELMTLGKKDMAVLHPLPRVNEIALAVDDDARAAYFEQADNGVYVRMALIASLLGVAGTLEPCSAKHTAELPRADMRCTSSRCICSIEGEISHRLILSANGEYRCAYCEHTVKS